MSPKNFDTHQSIVDILSKILTIKSFSFTESIFMKAVTQSMYCKHYTEFIKILYNLLYVEDIVMEKCDKFKHI